MPQNLSAAMQAVKKRKNVLSKQIIGESGIGKSQFYRILNGQETPSPESKKKISDALGIEISEFDILYARSIPNQSADENSSNLIRKPIFIILILSALMVGLIGLMMLRTQTSKDVDADTSIKVQNDSTLFIKDVTIPDGTSIPINTRYEKIWRVKNTGTVIWKNRYLKRVTPASDLVCASPAMVPIPETLPGQTINISVTFMTPHLPGSCRTDWKTSDKRGNLYFPEMHGLFSVVNVVAE